MKQSAGGETSLGADYVAHVKVIWQRWL